MEVILCNELSSNFLDMTLKAQVIKEKVYEIDIIKLKTYASKDSIKKLKRELTEWEKTCKYLINEISRIYTNLLKLNNKTNVPIKNETKF